MSYYEMDVSDPETPAIVAGPAGLPRIVNGWPDHALADPAAHVRPVPSRLVNRAFWRRVEVDPGLAVYEIKGDETATPHVASKTVRVTFAKVDDPAYEARLLAQVKADARSRIIDLVPEWTEENHAEKQRNAASRGIELLDIKVFDGSLTSDQEAERQQIKSVWAGVKTIRSASDATETNIRNASGNAAKKSAYDTWAAS